MRISADTCSVIAQVLPVFWLVLVVRGGGYTSTVKVFPVTGSFVLSGVIASFAVAEGMAIFGSANGLHGFAGYFVALTCVLALAHAAVDAILDLVLGPNPPKHQPFGTLAGRADHLERAARPPVKANHRPD
jgi:hypothetical protein